MCVYPVLCLHWSTERSAVVQIYMHPNCNYMGHVVYVCQAEQVRCFIFQKKQETEYVLVARSRKKKKHHQREGTHYFHHLNRPFPAKPILLPLGAK